MTRSEWTGRKSKRELVNPHQYLYVSIAPQVLILVEHKLSFFQTAGTEQNKDDCFTSKKKGF